MSSHFIGQKLLLRLRRCFERRCLLLVERGFVCGGMCSVVLLGSRFAFLKAARDFIGLKASLNNLI